MKIGVTSCGPGLNDRVDTRLGRCPFFVFVDTETLKFETVPNPNMTLRSGAGIQSAQLIADKGVSVILTGNCGPNAFHVFRTAGIHVISGVDGIVQDAVKRFKSHKLAPSSRPSVQDHFGMRDSEGMGDGRGMGMGCGMGMGTAISDREDVSSRASQPDGSIKAELDLLKAMASDIRRLLSEIESRIEAVSGKQ